MIQELVQQIRDSTRAITEGMHTAVPGQVLKIYMDKCVADVHPVMKFRKRDGSTIDYPNVTGVPIVFPQVWGQQATIAFPVHEGDMGILIIAEQSLDYWMYGHETETDLHFDLSDAIFIPGMWNKPNEVMTDALENDKIIVDTKGTRITVMDELVQIDSKQVVINCEHTLINGSITTINGFDSWN